jgi:catechol 2,3-dioxygenase-like lactoylglutathione lyase family enzyme
MSQLEAYRKQAKQLVRWHREGNYSIGGRIRGLPRYQHLTDAEALKLRFPLSEAQEIIAREGGFASWAELKASMTEEPQAARKPGNRAVIKTAIPVVFVSDVAQSSAFYRDKLHFSIDFLHGNPPFYAGISRDGVTLHLRFVHEPVIVQELREKESLLAAFILVENVKALFEEYIANGAPIVGTLQREPWGGPAFTVRDLDDNWIYFCQG